MQTTDRAPRFVEAENSTYGYRFKYAEEDKFVGYWMAQGVYEAPDSQVWAELVQPDSVVLDIGACIGHYGMVAAGRIDPSRGGVYAFEPQPDTFALLRENAALNAYAHLRAIPKAIGSAPGVTRVYRGSQNWGGHEVYSAAGALDSRQSAEVEVIDVDSFLAAEGITPTLVKMDVEGYEYHALQGMRGLLSDEGPLDLLMEFFPAIAERAKKTTGDGGIALVWSILRSHFEEIYWVDAENWMVQPADFPTLLDKCFGGGLVNVLCRRSAGWKARVPAGAGQEAFDPAYAEPLAFRKPPEEESLSLEDVRIRLIEMGHGRKALPVLDAAVVDLIERTANSGGFEAEDLVAHLRATGHEDVAGWTEQAIDDLKRLGGPETAVSTARKQAAPTPEIVVSTSVLPDTPERPHGCTYLPYRGLDDLRFHVAHAFEGSPEVRRRLYQPLANLVRPDERVVDIGCGDGLFLDLVRERRAAGVGIELDPAKIARCKQLGLQVVQGRAQDVDWSGLGPVDFVSMIQIIEHLAPAEVLEILDGAVRSLSERGRLLIVTPNFANPAVAHSNFWLDITHVRPYPELLLNSIVSALGFPYFQSGTMGDGMDTWCYAFRRAEDALSQGS